jgi:hypothetical protein
VKYLARGNYTVTYTTTATEPVRRDLYILKLTDNVGPYAPGGSSSGSTSGSSGSTSGSDSYYYTGDSSPPPMSCYYTY